MATLRIMIKGKKFVSHNNVDVEEFYSRYLKGNGWICKIYENGDFHCVATGTYNGGECRIKFKIEEGHLKLSLKIGDGTVKIIKKEKMDKWPIDGVIGLTSGPIHTRNAYFRDMDFQDFVEEYSITSIKSTSADGIYQLEKTVCEGCTTFEELIETDGNMLQIFEAEDYPNKDCKNVYQEVEVSNATWVIKKVFKSGVTKHKILFSEQSLSELQGLPKE